MKIHRTGPASPCAGDTDLRHVDILSLGEVGSRMEPRQFSALFQSLKADLLKTSPSLIPNPSSPNNLLTTVSACMLSDTGHRVGMAAIIDKSCHGGRVHVGLW